MGKKRFGLSVIGIVLIFVVVFATLSIAIRGKGFGNLSISLLIALTYLVGISFVFNNIQNLLKRMKEKAFIITLSVSLFALIIFFSVVTGEIDFMEIAILIIALMIVVLSLIPSKWIQKIIEALGLD